MKIEEAIGLLKQVCSVYRGTLDEHQMLQTALGVVIDRIKEDEEDKLGENKQDK